jgi:phenylalanyl-tRNA synthetase beta chain
LGEQSLPDENECLCLGAYGNTDFYTFKGIIETVLEGMDITGAEFCVPAEIPGTFHPGRTAEIRKDGTVIGTFGQIHPEVCENYELGKGTYAARLGLSELMSAMGNNIEYKPLPKYPAVTRDLSLVCDADLQVREIEKTITGSIGKFAEKIKLFDIYSGGQIGEGKKSVSYSLTLRSASATLTDEQADAAISRVLKALGKINVTQRV